MTAAPAVKAAILSILTGLYASQVPAVGVFYGRPEVEPDDYVAVTNIATESVTASFQGSTLPSTERHEVTVLVCTARFGGESAQQVVTERAYELLGMLLDYLRTDGQTAVAGTDATVTGYFLEEAVAAAQLTKGRSAVITATIVCEDL